MPESTDDPISLAGLLLEAASGLKRISGPSFETRHGLPTQSFDVLVRLARSPSRRLRMSDLAAQTSLTPSGLTRSVDRLEQAGLVHRDVCDEDKRGAFATLTLLGAKRMEEALACHRDDLECLLDRVLDRAERALLTAMLRRVRDEVNPAAARLSR